MPRPPTPPTKQNLRKPKVVFNPAAYRGFQRGVNLIADAVRPTVGPVPRKVAVARSAFSLPPEILDNGALIARRIEELPDRDQDMGAMFVRHVLWRLQDDVGDGTATAAVLFQSIYNQGLHYLVSGGSPVGLRKHLESGIEVVLGGLNATKREIHGQSQLAQLARTICHDDEMATVLGEIHDIIGEHGQLDIRDGRRHEIEREYVEGTYWDSGVLSPEMITDHGSGRVELPNTAMLITDITIKEPRDLAPLLELVLRAGIPSLMITVDEMSPAVRGFLVANRRPGTFGLAAVRTPNSGHAEGRMVMEDMAALTGGRPVIKDAGETLNGVALEHLGRARLIWADKSKFGIIGGKGDSRALQAHVGALQEAFTRAKDIGDRKRLRERIGRLMGGAAVMWVGGLGPAHVEARRALATYASDTLRGIVREGVVAGGGAALLNCVPALKHRQESASDPDERAAYRILASALETPMRTIAANAGYDASDVLSAVRSAGPGRGFDVLGGRVVDMTEAGILDSAAVQKALVRDVIGAAGLALTIEVLVQRKDPPVGKHNEAGA
jgi:chaperonin GroEL